MTKCFVPGCETRRGINKYAESDPLMGGKLGMFRAQSEAMRHKWEAAIGRTDRAMTKRHVVCELHFEQSEVQGDFTVPLKDDAIYSLPRDRKRLHPDAVPSKYLKCPLQAQEEMKQEIGQNHCFPLTTVDIKETTLLPENCSNENIKREPNEGGSDEIQEGQNQYFDLFSIAVNDITLPSDQWLHGRFKDHRLLFICLSQDYSRISKRVTIDVNCSVEVYLNNQKLNSPHLSKISSLSINSIGILLNRIDKLPACVGNIVNVETAIYIQRAPECEAIVRYKKGKETEQLLCRGCKEFKERYKTKKDLKGIIEEVRAQKANLTKQNKRLKAKIIRMRHEITGLRKLVPPHKRKIAEFSEDSSDEQQ